MFKFIISIIISGILALSPLNSYAAPSSWMGAIAFSSFLNPLQSTDANAQQAPGLPTDQFFVIEDFSKLLLSHQNPYTIGKEGVIDATNVRANEQAGSLAKRGVLNTLGTCSHTAAVTGLYRYYKSDGTKFTVNTSSTFLDYISDSGSCTTIDAQLTTGKRWTFITYKNWLVGSNGYDAPVKWDGKLTTTADTTGARTANDLVTTLGAPFAELLTGTGLTASRWYQYRIAYYNGTTYSYSTARTNPLLTGPNVHNIKLTDIPLGPSGTTHRYIYRTTGQTTRANVLADNTFYLVTDIADNTTTTFSDSVADGTITPDNPPTWATVSAGSNVTPPHGLFLFINKDYIWLANDPSGATYGQSTAYFSQVLNPDYWPATNYFLIRPDDGDQITGITSFLGQLTLLKTNTIQKIYTDQSTVTSWQLSQPFSFIGASAPYSVVATPLGLFYLGRYGLYKFDGQSSTLISDVVTKDIRDINATNYGNVASVYYNNEYRMAYTSTATGSGVNDRVLLFDIVRNSYTKDTQNVNAWALYNSADDYGALYSGSSNTDGYILSHSTQPTSLIYRYQSDLDAGTYVNTISSNATGDPNDLALSLGSSIWSADASAWNSESTSTWQVDSSPGTWTSGISRINASSFSKLYWNQVLGTAGTATIAIRTASTSGGIAGAAWSSEFSNPAGSDISGVSANNFIQIRVTLATSDYSTTPYLYIQDNFLIKVVYSQTGSSAETTIPSTWNTGWLDLVPSAYSAYLSNYPKTVREIDVYYDVPNGATGTMNFTIQNLKGTTSQQFSINLALPPTYTQNSQVWGYSNYHVYRWLPAGAGQSLVGDKFLVQLSENSLTQWKIQRIVFRYDVNPYVPFKIN